MNSAFVASLVLFVGGALELLLDGANDRSAIFLTGGWICLAIGGRR